MIKRILVLFLALLVMVLPGYATLASADGSKLIATSTKSTIKLDRSHVWLQGYNIQYSNYFKLRDVAAAFAHTPSAFNVKWNSKANAIEIVSGEAYTESSDNNAYYLPVTNALPTTASIIVDGKPYNMKAYTINNYTYFQLRDLASISDFNIQYDQAEDVIYLTSKWVEESYPTLSNQVLRSNALTSSYTRWADPVHHYTYTNDDGTVTTVDAQDKLYIHHYSGDYKLIGSTVLPLELPRFGAFYSGKTYNYVVYGQNNETEDNKAEVIRLVKYDKKFNRIGSVAVRDAYTVKPFDAGSVRLAEQGNLLVLHTARLRYMTEDGLNHQSQLTVLFDTEKMQVVNDLGRFQKNHVSHSFDQYVLFDGDSHVLLDHGDAYPRSLVISKGDGNSYVERDVVNIPGQIGANMTGVSIGGFEKSSSSYLVAYNTIDHSKAYNYTSFTISGASNAHRDIKIAAVPKNDVANGKIHYEHIATYINTDKTASIPRLVRIHDQKFMLLWQEFDREGSSRSSALKYVYIDANGKKIGQTKQLDYFKLADMQPVVANNDVVWFVNNDKDKTFYTVPIE
ncbi:hypothetical protein ACFP56_13865 [Paenibacillus septentrionalis]|uniref:Copper amine oxidase-like N-terminal domain-containing protein n=1 Tax=Paenibacillus septentrionalis TaxID=429342 RepID=A0ABW1V5G1_9BACL